MLTIKSIKLHILESNIKPVGYSQEINNYRDSAIIEIETSNSITGWGECFFNKATINNILYELCSNKLIGRNPYDWKSIRRDLFVATIRDGPHYGIISGIEIALLDIVGKDLGIPIHRLFGGAQREEIKVYATGCYRSDNWKTKSDIINGMIKEITTYVDNDFSLVKVKVGFSPLHDAEILDTIFEEMQGIVNIAADANACWDIPSALLFLSRLKKMELSFFEEPFPMSNLAGYKELRKKTHIPIACGEGIRSLSMFRDFIQSNAIDIIQPDIIIAGGFSALQNVEILASANNIRFIPHCWGSGISFISTAHFMSVLDGGIPWLNAINEPIMEFDQSENPLRNEIFVDELVCEKGYLKLPSKPGLGIEINRKKLESFYEERFK